MKPALAVLFGLGAFAAFAVPAVAAPDPYEIFARSRAYWTQQRYPMLIDYTIAVDVVEGGKERVEDYTSEFDALSNRLQVDPVSDYELAHPVVAKGMNLHLCYKLVWFRGSGGRCGAGNKPVPPIDFIGVPHLAPNYSFGMAPFVTPAPSPTWENGLPEITAVYAYNRDYRIVLLGTDTIDGHACYHLALTPMREPNRFRIRQAWIDEQTYAPWQLQNALNFATGPATAVGWMIHFSDVDGAHYIREEDALAPMSVGGEIYTKTAVTFISEHTVTRARPHELADAGIPLEEPQAP